MSGDYGPSIHLATFYERTSAKGLKYFAGRIGHASAALLPGEATEDGTPTWRLMVSQAKPPAGRAPSAQAQSTFAGGPSREPRRRAPYPARREARPPIRPDQPGAMLPDDDVSDIGRGRAP
jgi:hypothetical protein